MVALFNSAASSCPNSVIVAGGYRYVLLLCSYEYHESHIGYSQGAALVHRAIEGLSTSVKNKIVGAITYGDTQNTQDRGRIPNYPTEDTLIICNIGDLVCTGTLIILTPHLDYVRRTGEAVSFLTRKIREAGF